MSRRKLVVAALAGALCLLGCQSSSVGLELRLVRSKGVSNVANIVDGSRARNGADWNSALSSRFAPKSAEIVFDLGAKETVRGIYLQGDNNDTFQVSGSIDDKLYAPIWTASAVGGHGLQPRSIKDLNAEARYIKLTARGGDSFVSATEFQVFNEIRAWPPRVKVDWIWGPNETAKFFLWLLAALGVVALVASRWRTEKAFARVSGVVFFGAAAAVCFAISRAWPPHHELMNVGRAVAALLALAAAWRLWVDGEGSSSSKLATFVLAFAALLGVLSFYNFGQPQFRDAGKARASYVHTWDMRVYFPAAKYANELGYDGVYLASVAAYAEERLAGSHNSIRSTGVRDLRDYEMRTVADLSDEITGVPKRFSPERWAEFKKDMEYFWRSMGSGGYLGSLRDHGGNATPAWLLFAHGLFKTADATESTFLWTALLDPILLILFFVVAWRTFNVQTALFCLVVYGATTFPMFGSNWGGSTLRNDWMVLIGLGVCALHKKRFFLAGLLLGCSAMIRAFPVVTLFFLVTPLILFLLDHRKREGHLPLFSETLRAGKPLLSTAAGALLCAALLAGASTATFGFDRSWGEWSRKISMHADKPNVNHVGLRTVVTYDPSNDFSALAKLGKPSSDWGPLQVENLKRRSWLYYALMLMFTWLAVRACRRDNWADAALLGMMMIPIYFYPSNYYLHCIFVLPMLAPYSRIPVERKRFFWVAAILCVFCFAQFFGWYIRGHYGRYLAWSWMLLVAFVVVLFGLPRLREKPAASVL